MKRWRPVIALIVLCRGAVAVSWAVCPTGDWKCEIGYNALQARLGGATPTGTGIDVTHVEAPINPTTPPYIYLPDETLPHFTGKTFNAKCATCNNVAASSHASTVGSFYYGNFNMSSGITTIDVDEANNWINLFLKTGPQAPAVESRRIQNHSWIADAADSTANDINRRLDLVIQRDGVVVGVGTDNTENAIPKMLGTAYNVMTVALSTGVSSNGPTQSGLDGAGRVKPDISIPNTSFTANYVTSNATPIIGSSAALLLQVADANNILSGLAAGPRKVAKALVVKALIMGGATKDEFVGANAWRKGFTSPSTDGTVPFDYRYGAGEINIDNSHRILTVNGEEDASGSSLVALTGWDFASFTGTGTKQYFVEVPAFSYIQQLSILVTWNRKINQSGGTLTPSLANMDLKLYNATGFTVGTPRDSSISSIDNVEHIFLKQMVGGRYVFEVNSNLAWDYAIAWDTKLAPTIPPDLNGNGAVDNDDYTLFEGCLSGPNKPILPGCASSNFDADTDVDISDFAKLQKCFSGPGVVANSACFP